MFSKRVKDLLSSEEWLIRENGFEKDRVLSYESIFSLANGYMGTRGSFEEGYFNSLPTTFINGIFDKSETFMRELVNLPNWLSIKFNVEKDVINLDHQNIVSYERVLDMKKAILVRSVVIKDSHNRITHIEIIRFLSRANTHRAAMEIRITAKNYSGIMEVENMIDGTSVNFKDAPRFRVKHFVTTNNESLNKNDGIYLECETRNDKLTVGCGSALVNKNLRNRAYNAFGEIASEFKDFVVKKDKTVVLHKYAVYYTEKDVVKNSIKSSIKKELNELVKKGFNQELKEHINVYKKMWDVANIKIQGDKKLDNAVRFCIFQIMSCGNENDEKVNVGAKLLSGEEYGGHAFWDTELFMLPYFSWVFPKTAKNLENYRYNLLAAAKENALKTGYKGARYPWESADEGSEQCPLWTIYPDGHAEPCFVSKYEQHVTSAIAYGVINYTNVTDDYKFFENKGIEVLIETARFWTSRLEYNRKKDRYEINEVTGPDEWHEPVNNNLYTNYLAKWNLDVVVKVLEDYKKNKKEIYKRIVNKTHINDSEINCFKDRINKIYLPRKKDSHLLEQFEGYFKLKDVVIKEYDKNDWPIRPKELKKIDRIKTQIIKQADVVMLLYLLPDEFDDETVYENYHYYEARTLHGSSLSPSIYSIMGLRVNDNSKALRYLKRSATLDLKDLQKNGREGLHAANNAGVWKAIIFGFMGVVVKNNKLHINPHMPKQWKSIEFKLNFKGRLLSFKVTNKVKVNRISGKKLIININGRDREI